MHRLPACLIAAAAFAAMPASAAVYTVGSGAGCTHATIQAAIDAATASGGGDDIRLTGGPYTAQALTLHVDAAHGAIALSGGYATCTSAAPTGGVRSVVGGRSSGADPVLRISDTADATLRNLEIRDGNGGGGLVVEASAAGSATSRVRLVDTRVVNNASAIGGGVLLANYNPATTPERLRLQVQGSSEIAANIGYTRGGGLACVNARLDVLDAASIHENIAGDPGFAGSHDGGGIHAEDCLVTLSSSNPQALYFNAARLDGHGGGLYLTGAHARADIYAVSEGTSVFISSNYATRGGGIALAAGAQARVYGDAGLIDNHADVSGGAIWLAPGGAAGVDTRFLAQSALDGDAPEDAVGCANPDFCTQILRNRVIDDNGNDTPGPGAVLTVASGSAGAAHAAFRGVRLQQNDGYSLMLQESSRSQVSLDGSLVTDNTIRGGFGAFSVGSVDAAFVLSASTVAGNVFTQASTVFGTPTTCDVADDEIGTRLRRSIVWQPGHSLLFTLFDPPQASCFTHLIANDFGWLGAAADRVVADPAFENPGGGNYRPSAASPALDFAPANPSDAALDAGPRVIDLPAIANLFGAQDLGAYERTYSPVVTAAVTGTGGNVFPASQSVPYGQTASLTILPFGSGWRAILPLGGTCPAGTLAGTIYTTGPITAACAVTVDMIHDTTIALGGSSGEPAVYGQSITFTATLAASSPTGSVVFRDGANVLGTAPLSGISANFTTSALGVGTHSITAYYAGDVDNTPATSPVLVQTVNRNATTTTIASPTPIRLGQAATIMATVAPVSPPGAGTPTGTVSVQVTTAGGSGQCSIVLPATSCLLTPLGAYGPLSLSANYSGDANFNASTATQTLQVEPQFVGGSISGLTAGGLSLRLSVDGDPVHTFNPPTGATTFAFTGAVPVGATYTVNVAAHPSGLFCAVGNGSGTMPAGDVGNVAVACSSAPHAILSAALDDGIAYARYGQTLTYTATIANTGNAGASNVAVAAVASAGLDAGALTWTCVASGGASCGASGAGGLSDGANLPSSGRVTYTVRVPVRVVTTDPFVRLELRVNNGEATASDSDTLVLLRDGFDGQ